MMTQKELKAKALEVFEDLKRTYPVPAELSLELTNGRRVKSVVHSGFASGTFRGYPKSGRANIRVATKGVGEGALLQTLGHEYYHAVQVFRDGKSVNTNPTVRAERDREANKFGIKVCMLYMGFADEVPEWMPS